MILLEIGRGSVPLFGEWAGMCPIWSREGKVADNVLASEI